MIDPKAVAEELCHAASTDLEDLIRHVRHFQPGRGRFCLFVDGREPAALGPAH